MALFPGPTRTHKKGPSYRLVNGAIPGETAIKDGSLREVNHPDIPKRKKGWPVWRNIDLFFLG